MYQNEPTDGAVGLIVVLAVERRDALIVYAKASARRARRAARSGAAYLHEPYEGSPETVVVMAIGMRARVNRDATAYAVQRMREQAHATPPPVAFAIELPITGGASAMTPYGGANLRTRTRMPARASHPGPTPFLALIHRCSGWVPLPAGRSQNRRS